MMSEDVVWSAVIQFQTQPEDMGSQCVAGYLLSPDLTQQLFCRNDPASIQCQVGKKAKLSGAKTDPAVAHQNAVLFWVQEL
jgi:hypothetical protein